MGKCFINLEINAVGQISFLPSGKIFPLEKTIPMGMGEMKLTYIGRDLYFERFSKSGKFSYRMKLEEGGIYVLGPDHGFRHGDLPIEEQFFSSCKKVLQELSINLSELIVMRAGEIFNHQKFSCDIDRAYPKGTSNNSFITDGESTLKEYSRKSMRHINQYCADEVTWVGEISTATYAVEELIKVHGNGSLGRYVNRIVIWPGADANILRKKILEIEPNIKEMNEEEGEY